MPVRDVSTTMQEIGEKMNRAFRTTVTATTRLTFPVQNPSPNAWVRCEVINNEGEIFRSSTINIEVSENMNSTSSDVAEPTSSTLNTSSTSSTSNETKSSILFHLNLSEFERFRLHPIYKIMIDICLCVLLAVVLAIFYLYFFHIYD